MSSFRPPSGNEFKNTINNAQKEEANGNVFVPLRGMSLKTGFRRYLNFKSWKVFVPPTEGSLLGDRRKCPCGIRGMSLKTKQKKYNYIRSYL